jgi:hypothetical protein
MKKTYYLILFVLMLSATANAQTNWITKNIDEKLSIKFPAEPETVTRNGTNSYLVKGKDSIAYATTLVDFKVKTNLDSTALAPIKDKQEFADRMMAGMASKKTNYTFGAVTIGKWKTYTTYSIAGTENANKSTLWLKMILIGSKMYTLSCRVPANTVTKNNEVFFDSVEILK